MAVQRSRIRVEPRGWPAPVLDLTGRAGGLGRTGRAGEGAGAGWALRVHRAAGAALPLVDAGCLAGALLVARRVGTDPGGPAGLPGVGAAVVLWVGTFRVLGLHDPQSLPAFEELRRAVCAVAIGALQVALAASWQEGTVSRPWMASLAAAGLALEGAGRLALRSGLGLLRRRGRLGRALVAGTGREAVELIRALQHPGSDLRPVGVLDLGDPAWSGGGSAERVRRLRAELRDHGAHCVFVAPSGVGAGPLGDLVRAARHEGLAVRVFTPMPGVLPWRGSLHPCGPGGLAIGLRPVRLSPGQRALKRSLDLVGATLALVAGLPLLAAVTVVVKLSSPGPVLYRQDRVTRGGRTFPMYKFRTMTAGPPPEGGGIDPSALFFKLREDPRVTSVGRVLRRLSLDELPQLFNVIRGDMSLVGPRPLAADQVAGNEDLLGPRHEVRAGMTGWWQVNGRSDVPPDQAVQMDLLYVENWSLALDLYILLRTVGALAGGRGAY